MMLDLMLFLVLSACIPASAATTTTTTSITGQILLCARGQWPNGTAVANIPRSGSARTCGATCDTLCMCYKYQYHTDCYGYLGQCGSSKFTSWKKAVGGGACMKCNNNATDPRERVQQDKAKCEAKKVADALEEKKKQEAAAAAKKAKEQKLKTRGEELKKLCPATGSCTLSISTRLELKGATAFQGRDGMNAKSAVFFSLYETDGRPGETIVKSSLGASVKQAAEQPTTGTLIVTAVVTYTSDDQTGMALIEERMKAWTSDPAVLYSKLKATRGAFKSLSAVVAGVPGTVEVVSSSRPASTQNKNNNNNEEAIEFAHPTAVPPYIWFLVAAQVLL